MRHGAEIGGDDASIDVFAHGQREFRFVSDEFRGFHDLAQPDDLALAIGNLNPDRSLAGHALNENAFGAQAEAEVFCQAGDAVVLDAGIGLEFVSGDHRSGIDVRDLPGDIEFRAFVDEILRQVFQLVFVHRVLLIGTMEQRTGRQLVAAGDLGHGGLGFGAAIGALAHRERRHGVFLRRSCGCGLAAGFFRQALDSGSSSRNKLRRIGRGQAAGGDGLGHYHGLLSAPPLQLALGLGLRARVPPIEKAVPGDEGESESRLHPELRSAYGERGGEINGGGNHAGANDVRSRKVEVMDERVAENAAQQSLNGKGMLVEQPPGQQSQKRRHEGEQGETAEQLSDRGSSLARAEPAATQQGQHERNQQNGDAIGLQKDIANEGAGHADPIVRRLGAGSLGSGIQRRIEGGV